MKLLQKFDITFSFRHSVHTCIYNSCTQSSAEIFHSYPLDKARQLTSQHYDLR